jgi:hypothetical protein
LAERDQLGGATGALIVDGIQNVQPAVAGLRQRLIVIRDQPGSGIIGRAGQLRPRRPFPDISVNYVPVDWHATFNSKQQLTGITFTPAMLQMEAGETQFWIVVNSSADTILDLQCPTMVCRRRCRLSGLMQCQ